MKKILGLLLVAFIVVSLSACDFGNDVPDDILDCIQNPDDPDCEIPDEVDCVLNPDDPECEEPPVDCTVTPDDPECEEPPVDCAVTPDDPECDEPVECETGYELVGEDCVLIDTRTPQEILADAIVANWDGSLEHVEAIWDTIGTNGAYQMETIYNLTVEEDGVTEQINIHMTDRYVDGPNMIIHRLIEVDFVDDHAEFEVLFEETDSGVKVYYNTSFLREMLITAENDPNGEILEVLAALDADNEWFMFTFDDSLANMVELEVLKDMLQAAFIQEFGEDFFYDLQDELNLELDVDLDLDYSINLGMLFDYIYDNDWTNVETELNSWDVELLVSDLDAMYLVPEIVLELGYAEAGLLLIDPTIDVAAWVLELETNGTEAWVNSLTDEEILVLVEYYTDEEVVMVIGLVQTGELDDYLLEQLLEDPGFHDALMEVPGLDVVAFELALENLDLDALYLEDVDLSGLPEAVYEGQMAFDLFVAELALSAPEFASLLAPFSGTVQLGEDYKVYVDDAIYAFENLPMFEEYFTLDYYVDNDLLVYGIEVSDDVEIVTTVTLDASESTQLFIDLMGTVWEYGDGFESFAMPYVEFINCPAGMECLPFAEYAEILSNLNQLGDVELSYVYDPSNPESVTTVIDLTSIASSLHTMGGNSGTIVNASITIIETDIDTFNAPTDVADVNAIAQEFAKFSLILNGYEYLEGVSEYYEENPTELPTMATDIPLSFFEDVYPSYAFDHEMSFVTIGLDVSDPLNIVYNYEITLYWLDGTEVFDEAIGWDELYLNFGPGTGAPGRTEYLFFLDLVHDDNFSMTKLALVYLWENEEPYECYECGMEYVHIYDTDLYMYDGTNGMPMYIAYNGMIYDVSNHPGWATGTHNGMNAGTDITAALDASGHGTSVLNDLPMVGYLVYNMPS
jgi:predicted heme/steroid binding protein